MNMYIKYTIITVLIIGSFLFGTYHTAQPIAEPITITKEIEVIKIKEPKGTIVSLTIEDLYHNLATNYNHISKENRTLLLTSIAKAADKYKISPIVLYCLISVESSFRWWIDHPLVTVKSSEGKKVKTRAIGLGGIVYEIWGKELAQKGILETKSDLYSIEQNVNSIAYVYSKLKAMKLHPKANNAIESGLIRYFGGGYRSYFDKIDKEIAKLLKRKIYQ